MKLILTLLEISRPLNFIIAFFSVTVAALICSSDRFYLSEVIITSLSAAIIGAGGNVINDVFDLNIDKINRPNRPLPSGRINVKSAMIFYILLNLLGWTLAYTVREILFVIAILSTIVIFLYSYKLKKIPLAGNFIVAFMTGLAFVYGGLSVYNWKSAVIPAIFAFLINFIRELVKDAEDIEGDRQNGVITFPAKFGLKNTILLVISLSVILIIVTFLPYFGGIYNLYYLLIVVLFTNMFLVYSMKIIWEHPVKEKFSKSSSYLKLSMIFGLIAIWIGK